MIDYISSKNKNNSPLIFIHGIGSDADSFTNQIKKLGKNYFSVAINIPGYGKSKSINNPSINKYADIIYKFIVDNKFELPILVGHSLGGMIVQKIVIAHPKKFKACILIGTTARFGSSDPNWQRNFINSRLKPFNEGKTMEEVALISISNIVSKNTNKTKINLAANNMKKINVESYKSAIKSLINFNVSKNLYKIVIPTLLISGDEDILAPPKTMKKMHDKIKNSEFLILKDCGHLINVEKSEELNKIILNFIERNYLLSVNKEYYE